MYLYIGLENENGILICPQREREREREREGERERERERGEREREERERERVRENLLVEWTAELFNYQGVEGQSTDYQGDILLSLSLSPCNGVECVNISSLICTVCHLYQPSYITCM